MVCLFVCYKFVYVVVMVLLTFQWSYTMWFQDFPQRPWFSYSPSFSQFWNVKLIGLVGRTASTNTEPEQYLEESARWFPLCPSKCWYAEATVHLEPGSTGHPECTMECRCALEVRIWDSETDEGLLALTESFLCSHFNDYLLVSNV